MFVFACVECTCVSGGKQADVSECMRQPEVNLGCHSSDATHLVGGDRAAHWSGLTR